MNKVLIRIRQIDNNKQLPILIRENDDLSDFNEYSNISRSSQILSGMDKGEECEHHLKKALQELQDEKTTSNTAIPIPEIHRELGYDSLYKSDFILPKNYIRLKTLEFEDEYPDYDLDEEDQEWLENSKLDVTSSKFEEIVKEFERACSHKALLLGEAKCLLRSEPVHIVIAIYDYWLTKRVRTGQPLHISVKAEKAERCSNTPIDPYIAFRKRSEKMMTRKNRRVDEFSYERMYRLSCHMEKLSATIDLVSQREATKRLITQTERDLFIKRYQSGDSNKLQWKQCFTNLKLAQPLLKSVDNFKFAQRIRDNHKEGRRKRPHSTTAEVDRCSSEQLDLDVDFTFRPMSQCKYVRSKFTTIYNNHQSNHSDSLQSPSSHQSHHHNHCSDPTDPGTDQHSYFTNDTLARLYTLYIRDINSGLPPLEIRPFPHDNTKTTHTSPNSHTPITISSPPKSTATITTSSSYPRCSLPPSTDSTNNTTISNKRPLSDHNTVDDTPKRCYLPSQTNTISSHHNDGNLYTYQNPSLNSEHNIRRAFTESDRHLYEQKLSPTSMKELVDPLCNHSLNGDVYPARLSQVIDLNCLKSLTNKHLIVHDDIDEIAHFYSKSKGHKYNRNHHNHHHYQQQQQQKHWLNKKTKDNCLKPTNRLPIWKSEPRVMTNINKMA